MLQRVADWPALPGLRNLGTGTKLWHIMALSVRMRIQRADSFCFILSWLSNWMVTLNSMQGIRTIIDKNSQGSNLALLT